MKISYSSLDTFNTCSLKYKFQEIDRIKIPKNKFAVFGTLMHNALRYLHSTTPLPTLELLEKFYRDNWNKEVYPNEEEELIDFEQGLRILRQYYKTTDFNAAAPIGLETYFEAPINDNHSLSGKIDRIDRFNDGSFEIIDYKTSRQIPSQETIDSNLQLSIYALGLLKRWPQIDLSKIKLSLHFLKHGMKLSSFRTCEQIDATKSQILETISNIEKQEFKPMPNALCDWCGYQRHCPMFKHKFKNVEEASPTDQEMESLLTEMFVLEEKQKEDKARVAEIKDKINLFCDTNELDRVFCEKGFITRVSQQRFEYDPDELKSILEPAQLWNSILSPDSGKIKELLKTAPMKLIADIEKTKKLAKEFKKLNLTRKK